MKPTKYAKNAWRENNMSIPILLILLYLIYCTYTDIQKKEIPYYPSIFIYIFVLLLCMFIHYKNQNLNSHFIFSLIPGIILFGLSYITDESIGYGDSILLGLCCITTTPFNGLFIIAASFFYSTIFSLILLARGKSCKATIAFVPFIFAGYLTFLLTKI